MTAPGADGAAHGEPPHGTTLKGREYINVKTALVMPCLEKHFVNNDHML